MAPMNHLQGSNGDADTGNRLVDTLGEGEGGVNGEQRGSVYMTVCKTDNQWAFAVPRKELSPALCDSLEGWEMGGVFRSNRTYVNLWLIHVDVWQRPTQYYRAIVLQ